MVKKRSKPLADIPPARFGSKPVDGGHLIVEAKDYEEVAADPIAARYLRPFRMRRELVRGLDRWCLWLVGRAPSDICKSAVLEKRLEVVTDMRLANKKKTTKQSADTPHLFQENHPPDSNYVGSPAVVSESRKFYTAAHLPESVIT